MLFSPALISDDSGRLSHSLNLFRHIPTAVAVVAVVVAVVAVAVCLLLLLLLLSHTACIAVIVTQETLAHLQTQP